jgi:Na+/proline symporter
MNGMVNVVLYFPRYMMITGIAVLALAFCMPELRGMEKPDFETLLPIVLTRYVPAGVVGLLLAGLLAAFMSNFAATLNAAPAYLVNDIYQRFIDPNCPPRRAVRLSRLASCVVLAVGITFGMLATNINDTMLWIVGAVYSAYVIANVLKWYWWRFNGYGYFWGMVSGLTASLVIPELAELPAVHAWLESRVGNFNTLFLIPPILLISAGGCFLGALLTPPEENTVLLNFYRTTRPWGAWGPIRGLALAADPNFQPNMDCKRDLLNVAVGIVWQLCLTALPIYIVLQQWSWVGRIAGLLAVTSVILKFSWYDHLERAPATTAALPAGIEPARV